MRVREMIEKTKGSIEISDNRQDGPVVIVTNKNIKVGDVFYPEMFANPMPQIHTKDVWKTITIDVQKNVVIRERIMHLSDRQDLKNILVYGTHYCNIIDADDADDVDNSAHFMSNIINLNSDFLEYVIKQKVPASTVSAAIFDIIRDYADTYEYGSVEQLKARLLQVGIEFDIAFNEKQKNIISKVIEHQTENEDNDNTSSGCCNGKVFKIFLAKISSCFASIASRFQEDKADLQQQLYQNIKVHESQTVFDKKSELMSRLELKKQVKNCVQGIIQPANEVLLEKYHAQAIVPIGEYSTIEDDIDDSPC